MSKSRRRQELIPPWEMPSDPVQAVGWFMHWLLKVLVRFLWVAILVMVIVEIYLNGKASNVLNGIVAGVITLLVGLVLWGILAAVLAFLNITSTVTETLSEVQRMQRGFPPRRPASPYTRFADQEPEGKVVEGTITDLEEERKRRRGE